MNIHDFIGQSKPQRTTRLVAMKQNYTTASDCITFCHDAIPELMGDRTERIAMDYVSKWYPNIDYVLINSDEFYQLPK